MFVHLAKFSLMNIGTWQNGKESVSIFILLLVYFHMSEFGNILLTSDLSLTF